MLGFEVSLKICLLGSSIFLEHVGGKMEATPVASLSVWISIRIADGTIGVNFIEMFVQRKCCVKLYLTSRYLTPKVSTY
jgi:hypothetical protein